MKKLIFTLLLVFYTSIQAFAQQHVISAGVGAPNFPRFFFNNLDYKNNFSSTGLGPFHLKYEYFIHERIGVGLSLNYMSYSVTYTDLALDTALGVLKNNNIKISQKNLAINSRFNFHFLDHEKHDLYFGLGIGYKIGNPKIESDYKESTISVTLPSITNLGLESTLGYRYNFTESFGAYLEIGPAKSLVQFGLCTRF